MPRRLFNEGDQLLHGRPRQFAKTTAVRPVHRKIVACRPPSAHVKRLAFGDSLDAPSHCPVVPVSRRLDLSGERPRQAFHRITVPPPFLRLCELEAGAHARQGYDASTANRR